MRARFPVAGGHARPQAADQHVFEHRHADERPAQLEGACNAQPHDAVRSHAANRFAIEQDLAAIGRNEAGQQVVERGLAGAVGAKDADDFAFFDLHADALDRMQATKAFVQIANGKERHAEAFPRRARSHCQPGATMPFGRKNRINISIRL